MAKGWGVAVGALWALAGVASAKPSPRVTRLVEVDAVAVAAAIQPAAGRVRVVHAWASWCTACTVELPELSRLLRQARAADVVFISLDAPDAADEAARALAAAGVPGPRLRAASMAALAPLHRLDPAWDGALPATWVLAPDGRVVASNRGLTDFAELSSAIVNAAAHPRAPSTPEGRP